jgi:iron complex transport system substrate-binding protein
MKKFAPLLLSLLLLSVTLPTSVQAGAHAAFPVTIVDDHGNRIQLTHQPKRLISLDPRDTETLFALGLEARVVADGSQYAEGATGFARDFKYPSEWPSPWGRDYPIKSKQLPHIEGGFSGTPFDLEKIESLTPDLVLSLNSDQQTLQKLRELGLNVLIIDPSNIKGILHDVSIIGKATGATHQATLVLTNMRKQMAAVHTRLAPIRGRPTVYYEVDATNPAQPITVGPGTFIDEAIGLAGGKNVAAGVTTCSGTTCYPAFSLEALVKLDPSIIVLGDSNYGTSPDSVKSRGGWNTISAVQSGKIYPFDDDLLSRAGPRIMIGLEKLARLIHPEAFHKA